MKNAFKTLVGTITMMVVTLTLTSCGGTPKGSDSEVKDIVKQIIQERYDYKRALTTETLRQVVGEDEDIGERFSYLMSSLKVFDYDKVDLDTYTKKLDARYAEVLESDGDYYKSTREKNWKEFRPKLIALHAKCRELKNPDNIKMENIRQVSIDEEIGKSISEAEVTFGESYKRKIIYSAQHTEDGKLYVEVQGL